MTIIMFLVFIGLVVAYHVFQAYVFYEMRVSYRVDWETLGSPKPLNPCHTFSITFLDRFSPSNPELKSEFSRRGLKILRRLLMAQVFCFAIIAFLIFEDRLAL